MLFLIVCPVYIYSQSIQIDSLEIELASQGKDTLKVKTLLNLAASWLYFDIDKSIHYYKRVCEISEDLNYPYGLAEGHYQVGLCYMKYKQQPDSSLPYANRAIAVSDSLHLLKILLKSYRLKSICKRIKGDNSRTRYYTIKCLNISKKLNDSLGIGKAYGELGIFFFSKADYDSAAIYYMKAIDVFEKTRQEKLLGMTFSNIAKNYLKTDDNELAEKYLLKTLNIKDESWQLANFPIIYDNLGIVYTRKGDYKKAIEYFNQG
ncbi:MAG: tetratricopeptide repeat protein, partial [Chlorobi bacterium]|nr:tetratricopeptide repeat protein [Chlorobiota bacterium]